MSAPRSALQAKLSVPNAQPSSLATLSVSIMPSTTQPTLPLIRPKQLWQGVQLFCTTRAAGVGEPPYDSLNLGLGTEDNPANVLENRRRLRQVLPNEPAWLKQVHGVRVVDADDPNLFDFNQEPPAADASVSATPPAPTASGPMPPNAAKTRKNAGPILKTPTPSPAVSMSG